MMILSRESFLAFIADVFVGAKRTVMRSDIMKMVMGAAGRFLGLKQFLLEKLHECTREKQHIDNSQSTKSDSMEELYVDNDNRN